MFFPRLDPWSRRVYGVGGRLPVFSFRIGPVVGGAIALAVAACASDEPAALALNQEPAVALVSASSAPKAAWAKTELGELINSAPKSAVGGDRLNVEIG